MILLPALSACMAGGNRPLQLLSSNDPIFPPLAKSEGVQGYVVLEYAVSVQGVVLSARVVESQPEGVFDEAALIALASWVYKPMILDGVAQAAKKVRSRMDFRLGESERYKNY